MKLLRRSLIGVALVALVATGCAADESDAEPVEESAPSDVEESAPSDIVDVAIAAEQFPTLVAALQAAGLVDTLKGEGPFTVFAPTEEAFANALEALGISAEDLLADTETLTSILTYHVIPGAVMRSDLIGASDISVATVNGAEVTVNESMGTVTINNATVVAADIEASNGVIHVIDAVLLP